MRIHFINVGYGEAILVTKDNFTMLIDGGTNRPEEYNHLGCVRVEEYIKKQRLSKIDVVMITHIHDDHIGGLENVVKTFDIGEVWINAKPEEVPGDIARRFLPLVEGNLSGTLFRNALEGYTNIIEECRRKSIPILEKGRASGKLLLREGFSVEVLSPDLSVQKETAADFDHLFLEEDIEKAEKLFYDIDRKGNQTSIALRIQDGKTAVLLSGDKTKGWEDLYADYQEGLNSQILKITHHGQLDGMPPAMLKAAKPTHIVICTSRDRRFNSAHPEIIERAYAFLKESGKKGRVYVTGCLDCDMEEEKAIESVVFHCDERTGEIAAELMSKQNFNHWGESL